MADDSQRRRPRRVDWFDGMTLAVLAALYFTGTVPSAAAIAVLVAVTVAKAQVLPRTMAIVLVSGTVFGVALGAFDVLLEGRTFDVDDALWRGLLFGAAMAAVDAIGRFRRRSTS